MEARKVTVQVVGTQRLFLDAEAERIKQERTEQTLPGLYSCRNGTHFVVYEEDGESGLVRSTVKIRESGFEVVRTGAAGARLTFRAGVRCESRYDTPFGRLLLTFDVERVEVCLPQAKDAMAGEADASEADGPGEEWPFLSAKAFYVLETEGRPVSENTIEVRVLGSGI